MIIYIMKVIFLKRQILMGFFLFWNVENTKVDLMVNVKMATLSTKFVLKTLKYFSKGSFYGFKLSWLAWLIFIFKFLAFLSFM